MSSAAIQLKKEIQKPLTGFSCHEHSHRPGGSSQCLLWEEAHWWPCLSNKEKKKKRRSLGVQLTKETNKKDFNFTY